MPGGCGDCRAPLFLQQELGEPRACIRRREHRALAVDGERLLQQGGRLGPAIGMDERLGQIETRAGLGQHVVRSVGQPHRLAAETKRLAAALGDRRGASRDASPPDLGLGVSDDDCACLVDERQGGGYVASSSAASPSRARKYASMPAASGARGPSARANRNMCSACPHSPASASIAAACGADRHTAADLFAERLELGARPRGVRASLHDVTRERLDARELHAHVRLDPW